jgi:flagellar basal body P-ring protein FlgI
VVVLAAAACTTTPEPPPRAERVVVPARDVAPVLSDTIGAQASVSGMEPIFVSGYGVVVGLNGTGSTDVPLAISAVLEDEMSRLGVGKGDGPLAGVAPATLLRDPNTAVVLVQAVIPPAAAVGSKFDVKVEVLPGTSATSLQGGTLYTTNLYRGLRVPGGPATAPVAAARGEIFINPFEDPASDPLSSGRSLRTFGRVLDGGVVSTPFKPVLQLDNASHSRSRAVTAAINSRFPEGAGRMTTARGINEESIEINIPPAFRDNTDDFFQLLLHTRVDRSFPDQWAERYVSVLKESPDLATDLKWCLQSLGPVALPFIRSLYDYPEMIPRMAALEAGAKLGDPLVREHLETVIRFGPPVQRAPAVKLLAHLPSDPRINRFLLEVLDSPETDLRIAAYETLDSRNDPRIERIPLGSFQLDLVPASEPMVYITQARAPKVVLFGDLRVAEPAFVYAWDGRLIVSSESSSETVRAFYRDYRTGETSTNELPPDLASLVRFFAHKTTPEHPAPGLDFSYSDTVGALYELVHGGGVDAVFVPQTDVLALALLRARDAGALEVRPELADEDAEPIEPLPIEAAAAVLESDDPAAEPTAPEETDPARQQRRSRYVVPLNQPPPPPPGKDQPAKDPDDD